MDICIVFLRIYVGDDKRSSGFNDVDDKDQIIGMPLMLSLSESAWTQN